MVKVGKKKEIYIANIEYLIKRNIIKLIKIKVVNYF